MKERRSRAEEWKLFRKDHLFTQRRMAALIDVSRRTIQKIENAKVTPHPDTLRRFLTYKELHKDSSDALLG